MAKITNTYSGGLDQDIAKTKYPNTKYFDCLDLSITAESNQSQFSLSNEKGNQLLVNIPEVTLNKLLQTFSYTNLNGTTTSISYTNVSINSLASPITHYNPVIIGYCVVRDQIVLFTTDDTSANGGVGQIWILQYNQATFTATSLDLIYCHDVGFTTQHPIYDEARGRYENSNVIKVYWTDNHNYFRHCNIADSNLINIEPADLDIIADVSLSEPELLNVLQGGNFLNGEVQYAYNLYNLYGSESVTSPLSPLYSLSPTYKKGGIKGETSSKSLEVQIDNLDTDFDYIKVYRIYYDDFFQQPLISLIKEEPIPDAGSYIFVDDGGSFISYLSTEEFQFISAEPFYCKSIEEKDSYMFPANIRKDKFEVDWDARAYRFPANNQFTQVINNGVTIPNVTASTSYPDTEDTINPNDVNALFNDLTNQYKYQSNSNILGGTGPNVSYEFKLQPIVGDEHPFASGNYRKLNLTEQGAVNPLVPENTELKAYGSPFLNGKMRGFKRDETYRFGIVFFNAKGQESYVKWIGDIRIPAISDVDGQMTNPASGIFDFRLSQITGNNTELFVLYPEFTLTNLPTDQNIIGAKIVYVKREQKDKTIIAQGLINPTMYNPNDNPNGTASAINNLHHYIKDNRSGFADWYTFGAINDTALNDLGIPSGGLIFQTRPGLVQFISPEVNFLKNVKYKSGNYFVSAGMYTTYRQTTIHTNPTTTVFTYMPVLSANSKERLTKMSGMERLNTATGYQKIPLKDGKTIGVGFGDVNLIGSTYYRNYALYAGGSIPYPDFYAYGGTSFMADLDDGANYRYYHNNSGAVINTYGYAEPLSASGAYGFILADYKQQVNNQYGGNTYSSRTLNVYQPSSLYFEINSTTTSYTVPALQGDTFLSYFDSLRVLWDDQINQTSGIYSGGTTNYTGQEVLYFPVETEVNMDLRHDTHYSAGNASYTLHETVEEGEAVFDGNGWSGSVYNPIYTDLYLYNLIYSKQNDFVEYFPKPLNAPQQEEFDCRVLHSDRKFNGESIDNYTKYRPNNFMDVDAPFGPINRVIMVRDEIAYVQDNAFGLLSINPRVQVQGSDGVSVELGKGGILHDFNYISKEYGSIHQFGINASNSGLYVPDTTRQKIILSNPQTNVLTDIKGLHQFLINNISNDIITSHNPIEGIGVISVFDKLNNRMLFTFMDGTVSFTRPLTYSNVNKFTISFNELTQAFESFYSFTPNLYIKDRRRILSTDSTIKKLYVHNEGNYGVFYDQPPTTSKVVLIVNPAQGVSTVFQNLSWLTEVFDTNNQDLFNETLTGLRITNEYQDTGLITITPGINIRRLMREWHYTITRNTLSGNNDRIRNPYVKLELYFANANNKKVVVHDIVTDVVI